MRTWYVRGMQLTALVASLLAASSQSRAAGEEGTPTHFPLIKPERQDWSFSGPLGRYDPAQLRRGLEIYMEVCDFCHGLSLVAFRTLADPAGPALSDEAMRAIAASYPVVDGEDAKGNPVRRPGRASDYFPDPFANPEAAAANNNGAVPPDLSLVAKARGIAYGFPQFIVDGLIPYQEGGPDYVHALLTGYREPPEGLELPPGTSYNPFFASGLAIAMPPQLFDDVVTYTDGTPQTADQYARDIAAFLMWAAEPRLVERKRLGLEVIIFLVVFVGLLYFTKRRVWAPVAH